MSVAEYLDFYGGNVAWLAWQHFLLFALSLAGATLIGIGLGVAVAKNRAAATVAVPVVNLLQA